MFQIHSADRDLLRCYIEEYIHIHHNQLRMVGLEQMWHNQVSKYISKETHPPKTNQLLSPSKRIYQVMTISAF